MTTSHLLSQNTFPYDSCSLNPLLVPPLTVPFLMTHSLSLLFFPLNPPIPPIATHSSLFLVPSLTVPSLMTHSLSLVLHSKLPHTTHSPSLFSPTRSTSHNSLAIPHNWSSMENMNIAFSIHSNCADLPQHQPRKGDAIKWPVFCRDPFCARL